MKRILWTVVAVLLVSGAAVAQDFPRVEVFGGYSLLRLGLADSDLDEITSALAEEAPPGTTISANADKFMKRGFNASAAFNVTSSFGIVADFRYNRDNIVNFIVSGEGESVTGNVRLQDISVMGGPRFSYRGNETITPFAHALVGLDHWKVSGVVRALNENIELGLSDSNSGLGVALGGGLDINVNDGFAIRLIQADYFLTRHNNEQMNNINLAFGVVFRLGGR